MLHNSHPLGLFVVTAMLGFISRMSSGRHAYSSIVTTPHFCSLASRSLNTDISFEYTILANGFHAAQAPNLRSHCEP